MRRCRYCDRDITERQNSALWEDCDGVTICSAPAPGELYRVHLPVTP